MSDGNEAADGFELAKIHALELFGLEPNHELLKYILVPEGEETNEEKEQKLHEELYDRFWNREFPWRQSPGSRVTALIYANYTVALRQEIVKIKAHRPIFRKADPADCEALRQLFRQSDDYHHKLQPQVFKPVSDFSYSDDDITEAMFDENSLVLVAECGATVVGFVEAGIRRRSRTPALINPNCGFIYDIVVDSAYTGNGIGSALIKHVIKWTREKGLKTLELDVRVGNERARHLYEKLNFRMVNQRMELDIRFDLDQA